MKVGNKLLIGHLKQFNAGYCVEAFHWLNAHNCLDMLEVLRDKILSPSMCARRNVYVHLHV